MTTHAQLDQIAHVTQRASELHGDALEAFIFVAWWRYPYARRARADTVGVPVVVLAWACVRRMA